MVGDFSVGAGTLCILANRAQLRGRDYAPDTPGDANYDGRVDDNDLSILLTCWGWGWTWDQGNFKGSDVVDDNDLSLLLTNWTGSSAVPEPMTMGLLVLGGIATLRRRQ